jgi:hypothetical protein
MSAQSVQMIYILCMYIEACMYSQWSTQDSFFRGGSTNSVKDRGQENRDLEAVAT